MDTFTVPSDGTYILEAWGAGTEDVPAQSKVPAVRGGKGGYSFATMDLTEGQLIYVCVGGEGKLIALVQQGVVMPGGYNGGGDAVGDGTSNSQSAGGGATHFATGRNLGVLEHYEKYKDDVLLVAGGGGGSYNSNSIYYYSTGGDGGGLEGGEAVVHYINRSSALRITYEEGATIPGGGQEAVESVYTPIDTEHFMFRYGTFGKGSDRDGIHGTAAAPGTGTDSGAGGGWYGGALVISIKNTMQGGGMGGGGGSGHVKAGLNGQTIAGSQQFLSPQGELETGHDGNGYARITLVVGDDYVDESLDDLQPQTLTPVTGTSGDEAGSERLQSLDSTDAVDENDEPTAGYWEKTSDDTWVYHFKVVDPHKDYVVSEGSPLEYTEKGISYQSEAMDTPIALPGDTTTATIVNTMPTGNLTVGKRVVGGASEQEFSFTVLLKDTAGSPVNGVFGGVSFVNGSGSFRLKNGETKMISGIPAGYQYEVSEAETQYFDSVFDPREPKGTIAANETATVVCTNSYSPPPVAEPVDITLIKQETGHFITPGSYSFRADFEGLELNFRYDYTVGEERRSFSTNENGTAVVNIDGVTDGTVICFKKIRVGASYKFTEPGGDYTASYTVTDTASNGKIAKPQSDAPVNGSDLSTAWETADEGEQVTVRFTNQLERTSSLTISKTVIGLDRGDSFPVTFTITGLTPNASYRAEKGSVFYTFTANEDGEIIRTVSLRSGELIIVRNLPVGAGCQVFETLQDSSGYTPKAAINDETAELAKTQSSAQGAYDYSTEALTLDESETTTVAFTNRAAVGSLQISKQIVGNMGNRSKKFDFTVHLSYLFTNEDGTVDEIGFNGTLSGKLNGETVSLTFTDGDCTVTLGHLDTLVIEGIYHGMKYTVSEDAGIYSKAVSGNESGTINCNVNNGKVELGYVNTLEAHIPTGIAMNASGTAALFAALLSLAAVLLLLRNKRRT